LGPDWTESKEIRFDIVAQIPPGMPRDQTLVGVQSLLAEGLKIPVHHDKRELAHLELAVSRNGPKLREVKPDPVALNGVSVPGRVAGPQMSMQMLVTLMSRFERQTVLDQTGLAGFYEIKLEWAPDLNRPPQPDEAPPGPSIVVVDHAEQIPAEN